MELAVVENRFVVVALPRVPVPRLKLVLKRLVLVAVLKYPIPLAVKLVVEAPPFMEKSPEVTVEEALERNPLENVARPVCVSVPVWMALPMVTEPS